MSGHPDDLAALANPRLVAGKQTEVASLHGRFQDSITEHPFVELAYSPMSTFYSQILLRKGSMTGRIYRNCYIGIGKRITRSKQHHATASTHNSKHFPRLMAIKWGAEEAGTPEGQVFVSIKTGQLSKQRMLWRSLPEGSGRRLFSLRIHCGNNSAAPLCQ